MYYNSYVITCYYNMIYINSHPIKEKLWPNTWLPVRNETQGRIKKNRLLEINQRLQVIM